VLMRFIFGYEMALIGTVAMVTMYVAAFALEARGVLPSAPLLVDPVARARVSADYSELVRNFGVAIYIMAFVTGNVVRFGLLAKDRALEEANRQLRRAMDQARTGRLSGTRLGDFSIDDLLGRGGMGEVYAARRISDGKDVAIKLLHAHLGGEERVRMRFRREAEVVTRMPAGTVAEVYQFGTSEDGYDYMVMERLRGEDLGALLKRRERLDLAEVLHIVERVAQALDSAHALGVVHRDLKPQNVFICGELETGQTPDVRLLDFGVARLHESLAADAMTATAAVLGTPGYMAPEQASGGAIAPTADVFALGAIAYRAMTGKPAFPSRSPAGALFEALHYEPPPPSESVAGLPHDVDAVLRLALAKDATARYQSAGELARDLAAALRHELSEASRARAERLERTSGGDAGTMTSA
jgi:serine/threonine protein kinase